MLKVKNNGVETDELRIMYMDNSWAPLIRTAKNNRRELHKVPELCWEENKTADYIRRQLDHLGVDWRPCAGTGTVACIAQEQAGQHIAFRADIDGLPIKETGNVLWKSNIKGKMHGCGHDGHIAVLLAVAEWLKRHENELPGPVTLLFQPAEEGGFGAREMIKDGALAGVDMIFGWHNWPAIPLGKAVCAMGPMMSANGTFQIILNGSGGHASEPEKCSDPVLAAAAVVMGLQQLVSRRVSPRTSAVVSVTSIDAVSGITVIPSTAVLKGSVRAEKTALIYRLGDLLSSTATDIARGYGVEAEVEFSAQYPALINHQTETETFSHVLESEFGAEWQSNEIVPPIMASEDFSYYLEEIPGAFALIGAGDGGACDTPCHNSAYDFNDNLIEPMVKIITRLAGLLP